MPRLPTFNDLGERPIPRPATGVVRYQPATGAETAPGQAVAEVGAVVRNLGESLYQAQAEIDRARQASELADVLSRATEEMSLAELGAQRDPDFRTVNDRFAQQLEEIGSKYDEGITDPLVKASFHRRYRELALSKRLNVMTAAAGKEQNFQVARLDSALDLYVRTAGTTPNPAERELILSQGRIAINDMAVAGWITETDATAREKALLEQTDAATVMADMQVDPATTAVKLALGTDYAPNLSPVERQRFIAQGMSQAESMRARLEREEDARRKAEGDDALSQAYGKMADGKLSREEVDAIRLKITPAEYKGLLEGIDKQGQAEEDNHQAFAQVQSMLYSDPAAAGRLAQRYHAQGLLKDSTLASVLSNAHSLGRQEGPRSPYERARNYVTTSLDPGALNVDPAARSRLGLAVKEFDDWVAAQSAPPVAADLDKKANAVVRKYALIDMNEIVRGTAGASTSDPDAMLKDLAERGRRLQQEFKDGKITQQEYNRRREELNKARIAAEKAKANGN